MWGAIVLVGALVGWTQTAPAQHRTWIHQFGMDGQDLASGATLDGAGGMYVCGSTTGNLAAPVSGVFDGWVGRFDPWGNTLWLRQFGDTDSEHPAGAVLDATGGVFFGGHVQGGIGPQLGDNDVWLASYDGLGNERWSREYPTPTSDFVYGMAPDGSGGVFMGGFTRSGLSTSEDAWIARYDASGSPLWSRQFGSNLEDRIYGAASDSVGGVFVCGETRGTLGTASAGWYDAWVARYDGAGNQLWLRQFGSLSADGAGSIVSDGAGGVFVGGWTQWTLGGPFLGVMDAWLGRFDASGNQLWLRQMGTDRADNLSVMVDGRGGVVAVGGTQGSLAAPHAGQWDVWLAGFDGAGQLDWIEQFGTSESESAVAAGPDGTGGVFLCGTTRGSLAQPNAGQHDVWLARYDVALASETCTPAVVNSTGVPASLRAIGSSLTAANALTLVAEQLPAGSFTFFLASDVLGPPMPPAGSQGTLCLGGALCRFDRPGEVVLPAPTGSVQLAVDSTALPHPAGSVAVQVGETWSFQAWYRDGGPAPTSNLTNAVSVVFW